jgi:hypothetical protein
VEDSTRAGQMVALPGRRTRCPHHGRIGESCSLRAFRVPDNESLFAPVPATFLLQAHPEEEGLSEKQGDRRHGSTVWCVDTEGGARSTASGAHSIRSGLSSTSSSRTESREPDVWAGVCGRFRQVAGDPRSASPLAASRGGLMKSLCVLAVRRHAPAACCTSAQARNR